MIDSHVHLDSESFKKLDGGLDGVMERAHNAGVLRMVAPALHVESFHKLRQLAERYPNIFPACGVHPHEVTPARNRNLSERLEKELETAAFPIVGETGLEGHYDFTPMEIQLESLRAHLQVASAHNLPVILHCRETEELLYNELKAAKLLRTGVVHCFTGSWEWAERFLELGYYIGLTGIVTFKNSVQVQEVARNLPEDRLLVETDGPYLAPIPFRGKTNCPEYIPHIVTKVSELRETSPERVARTTVENTERLFGLPKR